MGAGAENERGNGAGDRAYFRVRTRLPLRYRQLAPEEHAGCAADIVATLEQPRCNLDRDLLAWLDRIERKLDRILEGIGIGEISNLGSWQDTEILLSGSGLSFDVCEAPPLATALLLEMELPEVPIRRVRSLATVVDSRSAEAGRSAFVSVAFETIRQLDRDAVVQYTVEVQRQQIRATESGEDSRR